MPTTSRFIISFSAAALALVATGAAQETSKSGLTAREMFYHGVSAAKPATAPTAPAKSPAKRPIHTPGKQPKEASVSDPPPVPVDEPPAVPHKKNPEGTRISLASDVSGPPLGLKYVVRKQVNGVMTEVPADSVFHAGDKIQLLVQTNSPGYLYIVNQGSSGTWKPLFPAPEVANGDNRVQPLQSYALPTDSVLTFDEHTGTENVTIVFSRAPVKDFEELIYSLQGPRNNPATTPADAPAPKLLVTYASVKIDDATVGRLRDTYSRDLVIERVDPNTPAAPGVDKKETAVYVVNPSGKPDSRLVADLRLIHQ